MANLPYVLAAIGLIAGPSGIFWATLNWRTDDTGKRLKQAGEIVAMFQALTVKLEERLATTEAALQTAQDQLRESQAETAQLEGELALARQECAELRAELHDLRSALDRLTGGKAS